MNLMPAAHAAARFVPPVPGLFWGDYPERAEAADPARERRHRLTAGHTAPRLSAWQRRVDGVRGQAQAWAGLSFAAFEALRPGLQARLAHEGLTAQAVDAACAYVVEAARRVLGRTAFDGQVIAALCMMDNRLVEMATGEGKSLATALAAALAALAGIPVHVLTANDYLVARDAEAFQPLFAQLGLRAAPVLAGQDTATRRAAYQQPIVYATAREVAFDYLRDRLQHGGEPGLARRLRTQALPADERPLLRGLCMALIDEADSVLVDEATMPLILSRRLRDPGAHAFLWQAWMVSARLREDLHFQALHEPRRVVLTDAGREEVARLAAALPPVWKNTLHREEILQLALAMRHLLHRDRDYLVTDPGDGEPPRIDLIDTVTGRIAEGRKWSAGLHALAAIKEGLPPEGELEVLSRITFQRFFRRYHRLAGMSGTLWEVRAELRSLYGLRILRVPPRLPLRRGVGPTRCFATDAARWQAVARRAAELAAAGRPVLIGTDSVAASQELSEVLQAAGVAHVVLNARHDAAEAAIVSCAGRPGRITVSTNMAGRGTDILLAPEALAAGGLHVLCCQRNPSRRHDRQLHGRAGRQGEPGSCETWASMESEPQGPWPVPRAVQALLQPRDPVEPLRVPSTLLDGMLRFLQYGHEKSQSRRRQRLFWHDWEAERQMSFCGNHRS
jgi:preprotein translocase subunit SecA